MKKTISLLILNIFLFSILVNAQENVLLFPNNEIITPDQSSYFMKVKVPEYFQLLIAKDKISKRLGFMEKRRFEYEKTSIKFNNTKDKDEILQHLRNLEKSRLENQRFIENNFNFLSNERKMHVLEQLQKHQQKLIEVKEKLPEPTQQRIVVAIESSSKVIGKFNTSTENIRVYEKLRKSKNGKKEE